MKIALIVFGVVLLLGFVLILNNKQNTRITAVEREQFHAKGLQIDWDRVLGMNEEDQCFIFRMIDEVDRKTLYLKRKQQGKENFAVTKKINELTPVSIPYKEF